MWVSVEVTYTIHVHVMLTPLKSNSQLAEVWRKLLWRAHSSQWLTDKNDSLRSEPVQSGQVQTLWEPEGAHGTDSQSKINVKNLVLLYHEAEDHINVIFCEYHHGFKVVCGIYQCI